MHREYHPEDDHHHGHSPAPRAGLAVVPSDPGDHERALIVFTALLGGLIGLDVLLGILGWDTRRFPAGLSPAMIAALLGAVQIVYGTLRSLARGRIGADLALAQACLAALVIGQPFVAAEVVFIALLGEVLEAWTFAHARRAMGRLVDQSPRTARVRRDGAEVEIPAHEVEVGDTVLVGPGERIAVDGRILVGRSTVDQSALTGESLPIDRGPGDPVFTGTINQFGAVEILAEKVGDETTFGQVLRLVAKARRKRANLEKTADRLARYFLPVVELVAIATLAAGYLLGWPDVWGRTVAVLVVACPCGLVLATPAAMLASMAWLARHGVLIKGGTALESLAACDTFAFDKTGTLTRGRPTVTGLVPLAGHDEDGLIALAAAAESTSRHPLAAAIVEEARRRSLAISAAAESTALPGAGVEARLDGTDVAACTVLVGNRRLLAERGIEPDAAVAEILGRCDARGETALLVAVDGAIAGVIGVHDPVRPEAHDVVHDLRHLKIREVAVLTGDREPAARAAAKKIHADTVAAELLPADKARWIEERQQAGRKVAMVGDGINDAPALARADAGIALGGVGADLAAEAGGLILLGDPLRVLPGLVELSRSTVRIIRQNIIGFAFGFNAVAMLSATFGVLGPIAAAVLHQVGSLLVLLNSMRLLVHGEWSELAPARWLRRLGERVRRLDDRVDLADAWSWAWARRRVAAAGLAVVGFAAYATSGWTTVGPDEVGLLRRFGRYAGRLEPGLHLRWPYPVEQVTVVAPERVRGLPIGFRLASRPGPDAGGWSSSHGRLSDDPIEDEGLLLTGDGRYVELSATLEYAVDHRTAGAFERFAFGLADADAALRPIAESAVRAVVARRELLDLLTVGRAEAETAASALIRERLQSYGFGIEVRRVTFQDIHPPLGVLDAYRDVSRAAGDLQRRVNEAGAYRDRVVAEARGQASAVGAAASAEARRRTALAGSEADAFTSLREARLASPSLTDLRLFWTTLADAMASKDKLILDE
ncbi:MAG: cation-translocating P-type ATPase family protein, partial [Isosphaeraceae bacterium]